MKYFSKTLKRHNFLINEELELKKEKREQKKRQRKVGRQRSFNHSRIILAMREGYVFQNKQVLKLYGLKQHLKNGKSEKVKEIVRHSCLQQKEESSQSWPTTTEKRQETDTK